VGDRFETHIRALMKKLTVAADPDIVEGLAQEVISQRPVEVVAELMSALGRLAQEESARIIYIAVMRLSMDPNGTFPQEMKEAAYGQLASRGEAALARYLLPTPPYREIADSDMPRDLDLEKMTLGMRKWKARGHARDFLGRLAKDRNPHVFRILLGNPRITEDDVVAWAARRPNMAHLQLEVALHRRWAVRPRIHEALARNPYTPAHLAAAYMPLLPSALLKTIRTDGSLHPLVRDAARDVLAIRRPGEGEGEE